MKRLEIVNSFLHDMSTGTWAACVLVIIILNARRLAATLPEVASALLDAQWAVFWMLLVALIVLAITGGFYLRYTRQKTRALSPEERATRRRLLIQKHVLLLAVYGAGTVWMWFLLRA
jgi:heme/copper-type cytochrome/quinol oxidase subunit 2